MNRRGFLSQILVAGAAFSILPGAGRLWKATRPAPEVLQIRDLLDLIYKLKRVRAGMDEPAVFFRVSGFHETRIEAVRFPILQPEPDEVAKLYGVQS